eukprot:jgi/Chrzof1/1749/Cz10g19170.t1_PPH1
MAGWSFWNWRGHKIHYVQAGSEGPPVVLIHGYGASAYHWRYQIPALSQTNRVYAVDLLGFGWSDKALVDYSSGNLWANQLGDFIKEVVAGNGKACEPVVLVGNSLGGYACLNAAASYPELVRGVALLNSAGPFADANKPPTVGTAAAATTSWYQPAMDLVMDTGKRAVMWFAFQRAKRPEQIKQVLQMVYASDASIDEDLVDSIVVPASDPNASEVFYRINSFKGPSKTVNDLLKQLKDKDMPLLLLWGDLDPWITPKRADAIMQLYPSAERVGLQSGHCPHDDTPAEANKALLGWLARLKEKASTPQLQA